MSQVHHSDDEAESKMAIKKIDKMSKVKWSVENEIPLNGVMLHNVING